MWSDITSVVNWHRAILVGLCIAAHGCGADSDDPPELPKLVHYDRQPKFATEDFSFIRAQEVDEDGTGGLFATCLHIPMRDAKGSTYDCALAVTLPIRPYNRKWPWAVSDAAERATKSFNARRRGLKEFKHADYRTCRAYRDQVQAHMRKAGWKGANLLFCPDYQGGLPEFYFSRGMLLIGDYHKWSRKPRKKSRKR